MRNLDKAAAALRGGRRDGRARNLGCLVPAALAIGAAMLPAIGAFVALEPIARGAVRSPQDALERDQGHREPVDGAGGLLERDRITLTRSLS